MQFLFATIYDKMEVVKLFLCKLTISLEIYSRLKYPAHRRGLGQLCTDRGGERITAPPPEISKTPQLSKCLVIYSGSDPVSKLQTGDVRLVPSN